jgi:hypothetical protein
MPSVQFLGAAVSLVFSKSFPILFPKSYPT